MRTKQVLCGILAALFLLGAGCADQKAPVPTESDVVPTTSAPNTQVTESEPTEPQSEILPALRELEENEVPVLFAIQTGDDTFDMCRIALNPMEHTLSEKEICYSYRCSYDSIWIRMSKHWTGGSSFTGFAQYHNAENPDPYRCATGVDYQTVPSDLMINYGKCYYSDDGSATNVLLKVENDDGSFTDVAIPDAVPEEVYDQSKMVVQPYYATVDGDNVILVYMSSPFQNTTSCDFVYCTYPVGKPESAQWRVSEIPMDYKPDAIISEWEGAYADGYLYFGTGLGFSSLNIKTGEITEIASIENVRSLSPNGTTTDPFSGAEIPIIWGSHDGIIIGEFTLYAPDSTSKFFLYVMQNNQLISIIEAENFSFSFYDTQLNLIRTDDTYADHSVVWMRCAKDD